jgi:D-alanyl-D-alanine-carboxypeptidase/D-alanyl-D-alanine-endopeptidase
MLRSLHRLLFLATALTCSLAAAAQSLPPLQAAEALGQDLYLRSGSTGLVLLVVRGNEVFFRGYGETAIGSGQAPGPDSLLRLCSLSKIFATDLFFKLAADKLVRLDTPLQHLAPPNVRIPSKDGHVITLGDLATHTSGLPREVHPAPAGVPHFTFPDYQQRWSWLPKQHLLSVPGTAALYSNVGFDLLGDALQNAARKPYPTLIAERTTTPLGMHETGYDPTAEQCARLLEGAHGEGPCTSTDATAASSGLYSTPRDMVQWLKYLLGTGTPQIPAQPAVAQAIYIQPSNLLRDQGLDHAGEPSGIGLGWIHTLAPAEPSPNEIIEKTGGGAGFLTYIALNQPHHIGIFVAATDGRVETHLNLFRAANDVLLTLAGLPTLPPEPLRTIRIAPKVRTRPPHAEAHPASHRPAKSRPGRRAKSARK